MMKSVYLSLLAGMVLLTGCQGSQTGVQPSDGLDPSAQRRVLEEPVDTVNQQVQQQFKNLPEHVSRDANRMQSEIQATQRQLDAEISALRAQMREVDAAQQAEFEGQLRDLEQQRSRLSQLDQQIKQISQVSWEQTRDGWDDLRASIHDDLESWFDLSDRHQTVSRRAIIETQRVTVEPVAPSSSGATQSR